MPVQYWVSLPVQNCSSDERVSLRSQCNSGPCDCCSPTRWIFTAIERSRHSSLRFPLCALSSEGGRCLPGYKLLCTASNIHKRGIRWCHNKRSEAPASFNRTHARTHARARCICRSPRLCRGANTETALSLKPDTMFSIISGSSVNLKRFSNFFESCVGLGV
jgi:hypothetical protein